VNTAIQLTRNTVWSAQATPPPDPASKREKEMKKVALEVTKEQLDLILTGLEERYRVLQDEKIEHLNEGHETRLLHEQLAEIYIDLYTEQIS
jgi:hypothetical protein